MKLSSVIAGAAFFTTSFGAPTAANNVLKGRAPPAPPVPLSLTAATYSISA
jgi:hypothetical protein